MRAFRLSRVTLVRIGIMSEKARRRKLSLLKVYFGTSQSQSVVEGDLINDFCNGHLTLPASDTAHFTLQTFSEGPIVMYQYQLSSYPLWRF